MIIGGRFRRFLERRAITSPGSNTDGTLDPAFNPNASDIVYTIAIQPDGKILVGGDSPPLAGKHATGSPGSTR